ncbi:MAG: aldehyde dehydrogenase family protein, partial [Gammaproteobacteria bacterium]|nr:aldehyde dehydrogenase family protein [Gammaproteobacteria bacterium]
MESINPTTGERLKTFDMWSDARTETALAAAAAAAPAWQATSYAERAQRFRAAAAELRNNIDYYASLITLEMGK